MYGIEKTGISRKSVARLLQGFAPESVGKSMKMYSKIRS